MHTTQARYFQLALLSEAMTTKKIKGKMCTQTIAWLASPLHMQLHLQDINFLVVKAKVVSYSFAFIEAGMIFCKIIPTDPSWVKKVFLLY